MSRTRRSFTGRKKHVNLKPRTKSRGKSRKAIIEDELVEMIEFDEVEINDFEDYHEK